MNEIIAFNGRKLKWGGLVHACFTTDVYIKKIREQQTPESFHVKNLCELFPDFNFDVDKDLFHDASQDAEPPTGN